MLNISKKLVLASKSPRRRELLKSIGVKFVVDPSDFEEKEEHETPRELALHNAIGKAEEIALRHDNALILGVDTVVTIDEHQIGKPKNAKDAKRILNLLHGRTHEVITAICLIDTETGKRKTGVSKTLVTMDNMEEWEMNEYIASGEGADKAAGYAIQGLGALFIKKISGDYFNVVGLPLNLLRRMLQ